MNAVEPGIGSVQVAADAIRAKLDLSFEFPALSEFTEIEARPLFSSSRRPFPEEVISTVTTTETAQFWLRGLIITEEHRIALLERHTTNEVLRITLGQIVDDWRVVSILPGTIVLERNGIRFTLSTTETLMIKNNQTIVDITTDLWHSYLNDDVFDEYRGEGYRHITPTAPD